MNIQLAKTKPFPVFINQVLKGVGQIFLQENALTGLLFLAGLGIASTSYALVAFLAACTGTLTAHVFKFPKDEINQGLYGFSPALVGVALLIFYHQSFVIWISIFLGSIAATFIQNLFIRKRVPVFTLPFVLVTWVLLYTGTLLKWPITEAIPYNIHDYDLFLFMFKGFGQVIFQDNLWVGVIFFLAICINSALTAFQAFLGATLAGVLASLYAIPTDLINQGLFSFNAVLCAIVFSGKQIKDGIWLLIAILISSLFSIVFFELKIPQLTFPFVAATMLTLIIKNKGKFSS